MRCILLFLLLTAYGDLFAADTLQYSVRRYTDENGLPQNSVKHIVPDKSGFIWLATENGLVRFDGQQFKTFNRSNLPIIESRVLHILPGRDPRYLYASVRQPNVIRISNGIAMVDTGFVQPSVHFRKKFNLPPSVIYAAQGSPDPYLAVDVDRYIIPVDSNAIYILSKNKLEYYQGAGKQYEIAIPGLQRQDFLNFFRIGTQLYYLKNREVFTLLNRSLLHAGKLKGDIEAHPLYRREGAALSLFWNSGAHEVFVRLGNALYLVVPDDYGNISTQLLLTDFDFNFYKITGVYYDVVRHRLFLGSTISGLFVLERKQFVTVQSNGASVDEVYYSQTSYSDNSVLTAQGAVLGLTIPSKTIQPIMSKPYMNDRSSILTDSLQHIWVKREKSVYKFTPGGNRQLREWAFPRKVDFLHEGKNGAIWVGAEDGLYAIRRDDDQPLPGSMVTHIPNITYLQQESADILWVASFWGLYRYHTSTGTIDTIQELKGMIIRSLYCAGIDELWITTYENGFFLYKQGKLTHFPVDRNQFLLTVHCIIEDDQGYCWLPTNKGLFQALKKDLLAYAEDNRRPVFYLYYTKEYGFGTNEFNGGCQPCALRLKNGYLSLPSLNGLVWFNPSTLNIELPDKELIIGDMLIDQQPVPFSDTIYLHQPFKQLKLVTYTPYFGHENNVQIEFALTGNGAQPVWLPVNRDNTITLSSLPSGTHTLMIRKLNGFGKNNFNYKKVILVVPPAFYETWWFKVGVVLLIIAGVFIYTRLRLKATHRKNKQLEIHVATRTQELQHTLTALTLSEKKLRQQMHLQDNLIAAITHDIKSPLKYMAITARHVHHELSSTDQMPKLQSNTKVLYNAAHRMYHLTDNMLQYIKFYSRNEELSEKNVCLHELVAEKIAIFQDMAAAQATRIENDIPPSLHISTDAQLLSIIIHNLLDNACKHTPMGLIRFSVKITQQHVQIMIEDSGKGMDRKIVNWCNSPPGTEVEEDAGENSAADHQGLGLSIVKELVAILHGQLVVWSEKNTGTTVVIVVAR